MVAVRKDRKQRDKTGQKSPETGLDKPIRP